MPRTSQKAKEEGEVVKRAPRKTATRAPRKTAVRKAAASEAAVPVLRKAPTRVVEEATKTPKPKREKSLYVSGALFGIGLLAAALIGSSDSGQINPSVVIAERNARLSAGAADATTSETQGQKANQVIPVQNTSNLPNGGLVPSTSRLETPPPVVEEVSTSTASSTDETASTTEDGTEEESDTEGMITDVVLEGDTASASESESSATEEMDGEITAE